MRADALGLFWQDMPKIKKAKLEEKYLPPEPTWTYPTYLPYLKESLEFDLPLMSDEDLMEAQAAGHPFVYDIECYINYFLIAFMDVVTEKIIYFERIGTDYGDGPWNDNEHKLNWIMNNVLIIGFNNNGYDSPIAQMAISGKSLQQMKAATNMIIQEGVKAWMLLRKLKMKKAPWNQIDIMEVAPLAGSLKIYSGRAGSKKMQDLPFHPEVELSEQQIAITRFYCGNDLNATRDLYLKLQKEIKLREEMSEQYGVDLRSKSDAQIAEAVIAHELEKILGHRPPNPSVEPGTAYRYKAPEFMEFQSPLMQSVMTTLSQTIFVVSEKGSIALPPQLANMKLQIGGSVYKMGIGGLHSTEKKASHFSDDLYQLSDHDVTSYYPFIILLCQLYPQHLGPAFLRVFHTIVYRRLAAKEEAGKLYAQLSEMDKTAPNYNAIKTEYEKQQGIANSLKIVINGTFGKLSSVYSLFYSPDLLIQTTLTGQLSLLMLIECFELNGIPVVSANTDGIVIKCPRTKFDLRDQILQWWQDKTKFNLEGTEYKALCSKDVNNYFAIKNNGEVKGKGAYAKAGLSKNHTTTICVEAVSAFLANGTPVKQTIDACADVTKFLTIRNVTGGGVACVYRDLGEEGKVNLEDMERQLKDTGWVGYHNNTWIKKEWIDAGKPYEKMALQLREAYGQARWTPVQHTFLGKAVRWYYAVAPEKHCYRMVYAKSGNKVPKSDGAKPMMELVPGVPSDIDWEWYYAEAERILKDVGYPL